MVSDIGSENMGYDIPEIHQDPLSRCGALHAERMMSLGRQHRVNVVGNSLHLSLGLSGTQDQIVGEGSQLRNVQDEDVGGFLFEGCPGDGPGFDLRIQCD